MAAVVLGVVALLVWGEVEHWRASRRRLGEPGHAVTEVVVVLGYRNRGRRINAINRWRVRAGLRSIESPESRLVLSGGPVGGGRPEAELMAEYARTTRGYTGPLVVENASRSTWENVRNSVPLIEDADRIKIVSNSLHAEKARAYLWRQRPDLAARLARGRDYRPGELLLLKPVLALIGLRGLRR
ncbi:YdcF family protein [Pseudonocardia sp. CA-107938]|uniref:YdcF family protein n=1 Tax=Pseudonocardia sp. CA-107938 TaxID=3240021 RepID=UPI003D89CB6C